MQCDDAIVSVVRRREPMDRKRETVFDRILIGISVRIVAPTARSMVQMNERSLLAWEMRLWDNSQHERFSI